MASSSKKISVIMSTFNEDVEWIKSSVDSILAQTYTCLELIIVCDNPSNKQLIDCIKTYEKRDRRIVFLVNEKNSGLVYSLNRALELCSGSYIARMDADDIAHINRLQVQLDYLTEQGLDLIGANVNLFSAERGVFYVTDKLRTHVHLKKLLSVGSIGVVHPTFFARREVYDTLEGYSNARHVEDKEFLARVLVSGFRVGNVPDVLLDVRYNSHSVTKTNAYYVYHLGRLVTKAYNDYLNSGSYEFDLERSYRICADSNVIAEFNEKQQCLAGIRLMLGNKRYIKAALFVVYTLFRHPTVYSNIKVNLYTRLGRFLEKLGI